MATTPFQRFDYEEWAALARESPAIFEEMRRREIENVIANAPVRVQQRLRGLQWRIDMERQKCANPMAACLRLYSMMWDAVLDEHGFISALQLLTNPDSSVQEWKRVDKEAQILLFETHKHKNKPH